jgi:hypothetical protein
LREVKLYLKNISETSTFDLRREVSIAISTPTLTVATNYVHSASCNKLFLTSYLFERYMEYIVVKLLELCMTPTRLYFKRLPTTYQIGPTSLTSRLTY